ncbi:hypothetical protein F5878DRAFT_644564 [Lentinula raphanica]|uniref:Uncharacterized protein n=1 Tax=Lentinula raphanica TaxID=153919 RepID=A0AA38U9V2_9AGAR|nr:hypothetical protein F5878DRAFT_644564 [Lentinula raphanica]
MVGRKKFENTVVFILESLAVLDIYVNLYYKYKMLLLLNFQTLKLRLFSRQGNMQFPDEIIVAITKLVYESQSPNASYKNIQNLLLVNKQFSRVAQEIIYELLQISVTSGVDEMMVAWAIKYGEDVDQRVFQKVKHISLYSSDHLEIPRITKDILTVMAVAPNLTTVSLYGIDLDALFIPWASSLGQPVHMSIIECTFAPPIFASHSYRVASLTMQDNCSDECLFPNLCFPTLQEADLTIGPAWLSTTLPSSIRILTLRGTVEDLFTAVDILMAIRSCGELDSLTFFGDFIWTEGTTDLLHGPIRNVTAPFLFVQNIAHSAGVKVLDLSQERFHWSLDGDLVNFPYLQGLKFRIVGEFAADDIQAILEQYPTVSHVTVVYDYSHDLLKGLASAMLYGTFITHLMLIEEGERERRIGLEDIMSLKTHVELTGLETELQELWLNGIRIWSR